MTDQIFSSIPTAQLIVEYCKRYSILDVVISPGSRNAPLTIGFSNDKTIQTYSVVDERCAAFFALGIAQKKGKPVAVICTSGSAVANYYPAVTEAYYSNIPLVVISADRPKHLIDIGDGQTIQQENFFQNHVCSSANLKDDTYQDASKSPLSFNSEKLKTTLAKCLENSLPIHINAAFDEPLYHTENAILPEVKAELEAVQIRHLESLDDQEEFVNNWNSAKRKLVLIGVNHSAHIDEEILDMLANDPSVIVMTEVTSNAAHKDFFQSIDSILAPIEKSENKDELFKKLQPDMLITMGGMLVSKKIKKYLREYQPKQHYHIGENKALDTFFCSPKHLKIKINSFFKNVLKDLEIVNSDYFKFWNPLKLETDQLLENYVKEIEYSDFKVFSQLFAHFPEHENVHFANSSTVRYANLFDARKKINAFSNRGTSGIDGSTSTSIGYAVASQQPTTLITGDLSFFYDSNALWNQYIPSDFKIIVINNSGGGIFRILPGDKENQYFQKYFETRHQLTAEHLSKMYNFNYAKVDNMKDLENTLPQFFSQKDNPQLLEIMTPTEVNDKVLLDFFNYLLPVFDGEF
ncbi:2-succinyl-5-enolpyruvyl-6-hydroxy-3-cyclohexene-1-carboxylic-acid synthase [Psychroflexus halocasei]|uniref:2-succinyl-5-enolpyruvyl-6-hydroxy-3-cyclohexene-1-carboxylate synthase n=1 Tax=Psychroflexus halocasei TaxID=908615 RepID=A0A1H3Y8C0_9FLAO|nr:2-succinyl-5-enolpyruvyl-6-hydroxy-3-cyclohexene-1-carboxylic-acid synthase [Psychroflexus halocasei]SEA07281.1 2-succinyl-5-enolpyruvyl-6-hydroxy-3-cyclohexene-1-carboxylate synthase [Psychroflexus halocasei]